MAEYTCSPRIWGSMAVLCTGCFNPPLPGTETDGSTGTVETTSAADSTSTGGGQQTSVGTTGVDPGDSSSSSSGSSPDSSGTTASPPLCSEDQIECAMECFDPLTDDEHCGDCNTSCSATESCTAGLCVSNCTDGEIDCDGQCTDPLSSLAYCGAGPDCSAMPGTTCDPGDLCIDGSCVGPNDCIGFVAAAIDADLIASAPGLLDTRMSIAWDGTNLWTSSGGGSGGVRLVEHDAAGMPLVDYAPGLDLRAVFTEGDGTAPLYARVLSSPLIRVQVAPGVFMGDVSLVGGTLDAQASVAWDSVDDRFISQHNGFIDRWEPGGLFADSITLVGYGVGNEPQYPQNRGVAFGHGCYLTIDDGMLSAWNAAGDRVDTIMLNQAVPGDFDHNFSVSYAMGRAWHGGVSDWFGYDVFGVAP